MSDLQDMKFLLLSKKEYPDRSVRGRWLTFDTPPAFVPYLRSGHAVV